MNLRSWDLSSDVEALVKECSQCADEFSCGVDDVNEQVQGCWCQSLPSIMPVDTKADCLCQGCLAKVIGAEINKQLDAAGSPKARLALAAPFKHQTDIVEHIDYTVNEKGLFVFSEWYHLKRARCCGNDCRHCVYK